MPVIEILNPQTLIPDVQSEYTIVDGIEQKLDLNEDSWATEYFVVIFHTGPLDPISTYTLKSVDKKNDTGPDSLTCKVIGVSMDTTHALFDWLDSDPDLSGFNVPLMSDRKAAICRQFGVLQQIKTGDQMMAGYPANSVFIIDSKDRVRYHCVLDTRVAINMAEISRMVRAFQATDGGKGLAMACWKEEQDTVTNNIADIKNYYSTKYGNGEKAVTGDTEKIDNEKEIFEFGGDRPQVHMDNGFGTAKGGNISETEKDNVTKDKNNPNEEHSPNTDTVFTAGEQPKNDDKKPDENEVFIEKNSDDSNIKPDNIQSDHGDQTLIKSKEEEKEPKEEEIVPKEENKESKDGVMKRIKNWVSDKF